MFPNCPEVVSAMARATNAMKAGLIVKTMRISRTSLTPVLCVRTRFSVCTGFRQKKSSTNPSLHKLDHLDSSSFGFTPALSFQMLQTPEGTIVGDQHGLDSQRVGGNHEIQVAHWLSATFEHGTHPRVLLRRLRIPGQTLNP